MNNEEAVNEDEIQEAHARIAELEEENETLREKVSELEAENVKLTNETREDAPKVREIRKYVAGEFVSIVIPNQVEREDGKIVEHINGKNAVIVATARGEFTIADPARIKKQSDA